MPLTGPGGIFKIKSVTLLKIDPRLGPAGLVRAFVLLRSTVAVPDRVRFDATTNQEHGVRVTPTRNPISFGADVTDHAQIEPDRVRVTGILTDTPLGLLATGQQLLLTATGRSRALEEFKKLEEIARSRELVVLACSLKYYTDLLITEISVPRTAASGDGLEISLTLEQQRIVGPAIGAAVSDIDAIVGDSGSPDIASAGTQVAESFG